MDRKTVFALSLLASPLAADYDPTQYPAYETCALCHGLFGVSHTAKFPNLGGQRPAYIEAQLRAFLSGARTNDGGQMSAIVTELHPLDIPLVVEWFSSQDPPAASAPTGPVSSVGEIDALGCLSCHTNTDASAADVPFLSAQHSGYLTKQMQDYRDGRRTHHDLAESHRKDLDLPDTALEAIARYFSAQDRP